MSDWGDRYRQAKSEADQARARLDKESEDLHARILDSEARPDDFLLIPSDFKGWIAAEAEFRRQLAALQQVLAERYLQVMRG